MIKKISIALVFVSVLFLLYQFSFNVEKQSQPLYFNKDCLSYGDEQQKQEDYDKYELLYHMDFYQVVKCIKMEKDTLNIHLISNKVELKTMKALVVMTLSHYDNVDEWLTVFDVYRDKKPLKNYDGPTNIVFYGKNNEKIYEFNAKELTK
jgi:hypothetical protein